ncbi:MAG: hypothetical protein PHS24_03265 [Bacilli bacterium]|nr:hypothetical protein [Bacilli bacterium]
MIVFVTGPMFSSKSKRIEEYYDAASYNSKDNILVFKPEKDTRDQSFVIPRSGKKIKAILINNLLQIKDYITDKTTDIFIDEINFFENLPENKKLLTSKFFLEREKRINKIILLFEYLNYQKGINIFLAGLDFNSERKPFGIAPFLISIATSTDKLNARCTKCNAAATHTNYKGIKDVEVIVGSDEYEALCPKHWFEAQETKDKDFINNIIKG